MIAVPSPRLRAYVTGGLVGLAAALAVGDPAPGLIGTALLVLGVIGIAGGSAPGVSVTAIGLPDSAVEGEEFGFTVRIVAEHRVGSTYVDLALSGLDIVEVKGARKIGRSTIFLPQVADVAELEVTVVANEWGRPSVGPLRLYTDSFLGMFDQRLRSSERHQLVAVPAEMTLRALLSPLETNLHVGDLVSSQRGSGSEFADMRQFRHGDDPRSVNWRMSSRSGELWVNDRHPERNGDVVLLVDARVESGTELETVVDRSVRLAAALLQAHAKRRHRLGLITLDGICRWVYPGMGELHRRRLLEQLMGVVSGEVIWEAVERAVLRAARRPSMVVALTPLMDPALAGLFHTLRRSGVDVSVVVLDVEQLLSSPAGQARELGRRIWSMERNRLRDRLAGEGIPITLWSSIESADVPLARLDDLRTSWRRLV